MEATLGARTLFRKEMRRFLRVPGQTVFSPLVTTSLYLLVFGSAVGGRTRMVQGVPYLEFITPGLVLLGIMSNGFLNTASSMIGMKFGGTIIDLLVTPLSAVEITFAFVGAAVMRALMVGSLTWLAAIVALGHVSIAHPLHAIAFPLLAATAFGALGLLTGIWAVTFEQLNVIPTFVLTPLTFLGGVFYDIRSLPGVFATLSRFNPVLYLVEGMRYGMIGTSAVNPDVGLAVLFGANVLIVGACVQALRTGWKLRS